jgi:tetratricopeptide (TPR) repeat protein
MKYIVIGLFIVFSSFSFAQSKEEIKEAGKLFKQEMYEEAMPLYKKFISIDPTNADYGFKYATCLVMLNKNNDQALTFLLHAEEQGETDAEVAFLIGRAYENKSDYIKAIEYYDRFIESTDKQQVKALKVKKRKKTCKKALKK